MTVLGIASENQGSGGTTKKIGLAQGLLVGSGIAGGGTIVVSLIELIRSEPEKAFKLLHDWGPWYFLAIFVAYAVSKLFNRGLDIAEHVGDRVAGSIESLVVEQRSLAEASHAQALAMQTMADKDDRDKQEMQILVAVVNSKVEQSLDEQKRQNRALERIEDALKINRPLESEHPQ